MTETAVMQPATENEVTETLSPYERAQQLFQAEIELDDKLISLHAELETAQHDAGQETLEAMLSGNPPSGRGTLRTVGVASQVHGTYTAIAEARLRRREAIQASYASEAEPLRTEAAALVKEASERQRTFDKLKTELESFEACEFMIKQTRQSSNEPIIVGRTQGIRDQAAALLTRAEHLESRRVVDSGELVLDRLTKLDEVLGRFSSCVAIGPSRHELRSWFVEVQALPDAKPPRGAGLRPGENLTAIKLVWRDGAIVPGESGKRWAPPAGQWA